jgi:hypothetical protein
MLAVFGAKTEFAQSGGVNAGAKKERNERDPLRELQRLHALMQLSGFKANSGCLLTGCMWSTVVAKSPQYPHR